MTETFRKGSMMVFSVPVPDELENARLDADHIACTYSVYNHHDMPLLENAGIDGVDVNQLDFESELVIAIPPLPEMETQDDPAFAMPYFRIVIAISTLEDGHIGQLIYEHVDGFYLEDKAPLLQPFDNSFATYGFLMSVAGGRLDVCELRNATDTERMTAFVQAFDDLRDLPLLIERTINHKLQKVPLYEWLAAEGLHELSPLELRAFTLAQVQQANFILGGYPSEHARREGMVQQTGGHSMRTWRSGKVFDVAACRAAQKTLKHYINYKTLVGRSA